MMIYLLLILFITTIIVVAKDYKNRFNYILAAGLIGLSIMMISILLTIMISPPTYGYVQVPLFKIDQILYFKIRRTIKITPSAALKMGNLGMSIYLVFQYFITKQFEDYKRKGIVLYIKQFYTAGFILLLNFIRHPKFAYYLYIKYHLSSGNEKIMLLWTLNIILVIFNALFIISLARPFIVLYQYYKISKSKIIKIQVRNIACFLGLLNSFLFYEFIIGSLAICSDSVIYSGFWNDFGKANIISHMEYFIMQVIVLSLMVVVLITIFSNNKLDYFKTIKENSISRKMNQINNNMKDILHAHKNILFTLRFYTQQVLDAHTEEDRTKALQKLLELENYNITMTSNTLDNLRNIKDVRQTSNIQECIQVAIKEAGVPDSIRVQVDSQVEQLLCNIPACYLVRALVNIINNAVEALQIDSRTDGSIKIIISKEHEYAFVQIKDNGPGINKANLKKIFQPYFSTKQRQKNWGVGLAYVHKVITTYYGYVWAESENNVGTTINILLNRG